MTLVKARSSTLLIFSTTHQKSQFAQHASRQLNSLFHHQHKFLSVAVGFDFVWRLIESQCVARANTI